MARTRFLTHQVARLPSVFLLKYFCVDSMTFLEFPPKTFPLKNILYKNQKETSAKLLKTCEKNDKCVDQNKQTNLVDIPTYGLCLD